MKTSNRIVRSNNQNLLIFIAIIIQLIGLTFKANAKTDPDKLGADLVSKSIKLHLNNSDLSVLIPKVPMEQLVTLENVIDGEMVYVTTDQKGFYMFSENQWAKVSAVTVLKIVQENIVLSSPNVENIILTEATNRHSNVLDYNGHIKKLHEHFDLNNSEQNFPATKTKK